MVESALFSSGPIRHDHALLITPVSVQMDVEETDFTPPASHSLPTLLKQTPNTIEFLYGNNTLNQ